jgi:glycosyltransferase involved in cell wall biosynthesis
LKILCVIDSLGSGGAQRQLIELAIGFKGKGNEVSFLTYYDYNFHDSTLEKNEISITCIKETNYLRRLIKMRRFIRRGRYDAVISFLEAASFISEVAGLPFKKWKLVIGERSSNPAISKSLKLRIYRWYHLFADYIVANSYSNLKIVQSVNPLLPKSKCRIIYNIVDFKLWKPSPSYLPRMDGKLKLIVVASHQFLKNLNGLVEALSLLSKEKRSKLTIDWYGDRLCEPFFDNSIIEAKQKIKALELDNMITFYPATIQLVQEVQKADAVGLFSFYEGLPNTICEAMSCGKPIVCSAVSDLPNLLSQDVNLLCDPSKPQSIMQAINYLIDLTNDQLIQFGKRNLVIAKQTFEKELIIAKYLELFRK